jgi:hypothetical protein
LAVHRRSFGLSARCPLCALSSPRPCPVAGLPGSVASCCRSLPPSLLPSPSPPLPLSLPPAFPFLVPRSRRPAELQAGRGHLAGAPGHTHAAMRTSSPRHARSAFRPPSPLFPVPFPFSLSRQPRVSVCVCRL